MTNIFLYPLLLSIPLALLSAPIGTILVWRRSSFLSDVVAHMGILAFAISEFTSSPILLSAIATSVTTALLLEYHPSWLPKDAWLSSLASAGIALGLIFLNFSTPNHGIETVFWGDLLTVSEKDIFIFYGAAAFLLMNLIVIWKSLMLIVFNLQMAALDGIPVRLVAVMINIIAGVAIALCLKMMGVLLTGALFTLPTLGIRQFQLSPEKHVVLSVFVTWGTYISTLFLSSVLDLAIAPLFILNLLIINLLLFSINRLKKAL